MVSQQLILNFTNYYLTTTTAHFYYFTYSSTNLNSYNHLHQLFHHCILLGVASFGSFCYFGGALPFFDFGNVILDYYQNYFSSYCYQPLPWYFNFSGNFYDPVTNSNFHHPFLQNHQGSHHHPRSLLVDRLPSKNDPGHLKG